MAAFPCRWDVSQMLYGVFVLLLWTVTSFFCHYSGKAFLTSASVISQLDEEMSSSYTFWIAKSGHALFLTLIQLAMCYLTVQMNNDTKTSTYSWMAKIGHSLATLATNFSMALMFASSTFAIKLMEPITSAMTQYLIIGTPLSHVTVSTLPVIVGGAIVFAGNPLQYANTSFGTLAALVSNLILAFRNIAIKQLNTQTKTAMNLHLDVKKMATCVSLGVTLCGIELILERSHLLPPDSTYATAMLCSSALFHVAYSYVSTGMVLNKISVVSHAVANILKRVLVVLLLYAVGQRVATATNFLGLAGCTVGLLVYVWDKTRPKDSATNIGVCIHADSNEENQCHSVYLSSDSQDKCLLFRRLKLSKLVLLGMASLCILAVIGSSSSFSENTSGRARELFFSHRVENTNRASGNLVTNGYPPRNSADSHGILKNEELERFENPSQASKDMTPKTYFSRSSFSAGSHRRPTDDELKPLLDEFVTSSTLDLSEFLELRLIDQPANMAGMLSSQLRDTKEVIREAQRIHFNLLEDALRQYKYAILLDIASHENKGDPAITVGEILFVWRMNIEIVYYCDFHQCTPNNIERARILAQKYTPDQLVILCHGGGNIILYPVSDNLRFSILRAFQGYQILIFPQSIPEPNGNSQHVQSTIRRYCCNQNLTLVLRDHLSYSRAKRLYNGTTRLLMAPDMAFQIGRVPRFINPVFDILWIKRSDGESPGYSELKRVPKHLRVHVSDWLLWKTPQAGTSLEQAFYNAANGYLYVQRGRVVITDRLHGHILCTLMDIPHVLIDNKAKKLSGYHNTWTRSLHNTFITSNPDEALDLAIKLLEKYNQTLPAVAPYMNLSEDFSPVVDGEPSMKYA